MSNENDSPIINAKDEFGNVSPDVEWGVVCVDCQQIQNPESVMRSPWYKQGMTPPCGCGGVTIEIPLDQYKTFVDNCSAGKRYL